MCVTFAQEGLGAEPRPVYDARREGRRRRQWPRQGVARRRSRRDGVSHPKAQTQAQSGSRPPGSLAIAASLDPGAGSGQGLGSTHQNVARGRGLLCGGRVRDGTSARAATDVGQ